MPLLHDVLNAYLAPLLKKHSVGAFLSFEDLHASMEAAKATLAESPNEFVLKRVQNLHDSQVKAYQETAKKALERWAENHSRVPTVLETVSKGETQDAFVARYWAWMKSKRPNWQLSDAMVEECIYKTVAKKATETYQSSPNAVAAATTIQSPTQQQQLKKLDSQQSQPSTSEDEGEIEETAEGEEEEGEMMEDEEEEEGEEDEGEDGELGDEEGEEEEPEEPEEPVVPKKRSSIRRKKTGQRQQQPNKKRVVKKKTNNTKKALSGKAATGGKKTVARGKKATGKKGRAGSIKNA